jgi:hypothetical protein
MHKTHKIIRRGLLILDCTAKTERKSEGNLIYELMRILDYDRKLSLKRPLKIKRKDTFLKKLNNTNAYSIHISSHGDHDEKGTYFALPFGGKVYAGHLKDLWENRNLREKPRLLALSACFTGSEDLIKAFSDAGCQYCIAPKKDPFWHDAALFWTKFYTVLFFECLKSSPWIAFKKTQEILPTLSGNWTFFKWGKQR